MNTKVKDKSDLAFSRITCKQKSAIKDTAPFKNGPILSHVVILLIQSLGTRVLQSF